jgi:hypothetical protein
MEGAAVRGPLAVEGQEREDTDLASDSEDRPQGMTWKSFMAVAPAYSSPNGGG